MTDAHWQHLYHLRGELTRKFSKKYIDGVREHKSLLSDLAALELIDHAIAEVLDQAAYLLTLRDKLVRLDEDTTKLITGLTERIAAQSELLTQRAGRNEQSTVDNSVPHTPGPELDADTE